MKKAHKPFDFKHLVSTDDLESWCERYGLSPKTSQCLFCEEKITTTIPIFGLTFRGLKSPICACGKDSNFHHYVLTNDAYLDFIPCMF